METVRVLRILEYIGERSLVEGTLEKGGVPATGTKTVGGLTIRSGVVGVYPEILDALDLPQSPRERNLEMVLKDMLNLIDEHGDRILQAHGTRIMNARKALK